MATGDLEHTAWTPFEDANSLQQSADGFRGKENEADVDAAITFVESLCDKAVPNGNRATMGYENPARFGNTMAQVFAPRVIELMRRNVPMPDIQRTILREIEDLEGSMIETAQITRGMIEAVLKAQNVVEVHVQPNQSVHLRQLNTNRAVDRLMQRLNPELIDMPVSKGVPPVRDTQVIIQAVDRAHREAIGINRQAS